MNRRLLAVLWCLVVASPAVSQVENPDFRIKAQFRDASGESVGNANFRVKSRFMQVYYGGVSRHDEYRFQIELHSSAFAGQSVNVFVKDQLVAGLTADSSGFFDQTYRSDFKPDDAPDLPLPADFPDLVNVGDVVNVYDSVTNSLLLSSIFGEEFSRGDVDQDGDVDIDDLEPWRSNFGGLGVGPAVGDFSGDSRAEGRDFLIWQQNLSGSGGSPLTTIPEPSGLALIGIASLATAMVRRRSKLSGLSCNR